MASQESFDRTGQTSGRRMPPDPAFSGSASGSGMSGSSSSSGQSRQTDGMVDQAGQMAGQMKDQVKEQASSKLSDQKSRAAEGLQGVATMVAQFGDQVREQNPSVAGVVDTAADRLRQFSNHLDQHELSELMDDVERYARRNPALFAGGAFALGLLGARFLRSSSPSSSGSSSSQMSYGSSYRPSYESSYGAYDATRQNYGATRGSQDVHGYRSTGTTGAPSSTATVSDAMTGGTSSANRTGYTNTPPATPDTEV
jgi:hypothetical protein